MITIKHHKVLVFCILIFIFSIFAYNVDSRLVANDEQPIFVIPVSIAKDGGTTQYYGIGYKVISWNVLSIKEINGKEVDGKMIGYEISTLFNLQHIDDGPKKELNFVPNK